MRDMLAGHFHKLLVIYYFDILINQSSSWESNCAVATLCASLKEAQQVDDSALSEAQAPSCVHLP